MASRTASRAVLRSSFRPTTTTTTTTAYSARFALPVQGLRVTRGFASEAKSPSSSSSSSPPPQDTKSPPGSGNPGSQGSPGKSSNGLLWAALAIAGAGGYFYLKGGDAVTSKDFTPTQKDYQKVYDAIAHKLADETDYDDGSYGPVVLRLAWHASGTYDKETGTGGSNGATMRFSPESDHDANAGLKVARDFLEPIKAKFPWITYADLWTLAGACAIQELGGPVIPWRPGRVDRDVSACAPDGRLPDGGKDHSHVRDVFSRLGFNDQEMVALIGAHALGRAHSDRSGFDGPWDFSPTVFTNEFYRLLVEENWDQKKWNGPKQFTDKSTQTLMMMPTDISLVKDKGFKKHVERYAKDSDAFFKDFADAFVKLIELGVPFSSKPEDRFVFKTSD